jgi:hypothetical protein
MEAREEDVVPFNDPMHSGPVRPGARQRAAVMLLVATALAALVGAGIFLAVLRGDFLTGPATAVMDFLFQRPTVAMIAATSPLFAAMLVGYGYMQRALRRRAEKKAAQAAGSP